MLRCLVVVCLLAACPGTPKSTVGRTRETAIPVAIGSTRDDVPAKNFPHWYVVSLPQDPPSQLEATASPKSAGDLDVELYAADGNRLTSGPITASLDRIAGTIYVRVSGTVTGYGLHVSSSPAEPDDPPYYPPCNVNDIDPKNPNCAGVVACDHNKPDFKNPACCSMRCLNGPCMFELVAGDEGPDKVFAWISVGSTRGIVRGLNGTAEVTMLDGSRKQVSASVTEVQRDRAKILVGPGVDLDRVAHNLLRVEYPPPCRAREP